MSSTLNALNDAINAHLADSLDEPGFSTGWVLITSVSTTDDTSKYVSYNSPGLPYHSAIGLLAVASSNMEVQ